MRKIRCWTYGVSLVLWLTGIAWGQGVYQEAGGLVVMEAENASLVDAWIAQSYPPATDATMAGALGGAWLEWTGSQYSGNTIPESSAVAVLSYRFQINTPGEYRFRWRSKQYNDAPTFDAGNDTFVRFATGTTAGPYDFSSFCKVWVQSKDNWSWSTTFEPAHGTHYWDEAARYYPAGVHEIQLAARSPNHAIDRIVLHHSSVPFDASTFESAPESTREAGPPYSFEAVSDFPDIHAGEVPYYVDGNRLAIDAANVSYRGLFARAELTYTNIPGTYAVTITALQETDGESIYRLLVDGVVVGTATNSPTSTDYAPESHVFKDITIARGATLAVESNTDTNGLIPEGGGTAWARGRWTTLTLSTFVADDPVMLPARIEAEDYNNGGQGVAYHDATSGNAGGAYRDEDVDIEVCSDTGGGYNVGYMDTGEWLAYAIEVPQEGFYNINLRAASDPGGGSVKLQVDGADIGSTLPVPSTGGWQAYVDLAMTDVYLPADAGELRLVVVGGGFNVNYIDVLPGLGEPIVDAGPDKFLILPDNSVVLSGSATDNSAITSIVWAQESGPAAAALSGTNTTTLSVSGLVEGSYVFSLTATDDEANSVSDEASVFVLPEGSGLARITGELRTWHKVTLSWDGPSTSESATPNPFTDYRLDVTFNHAGSGKSYVVPGYYAADGDAAESSAAAGNVWRVHFAPDEIGEWIYTVSFRTGGNVAMAASSSSGSSAGYFDGDAGDFTIVPSDKTGRDFRGKGRLRYVNKHHLQFAETGEYFVKAGADAPENFLAYEDFDNTPNDGGRRKNWGPHVQDWNTGDPTWKGTQGKGIIGALNYLSEKGCNVQSFLTYSHNGDDKNVSPYISGNDRYRLDCSKLDQWEIVFGQGDRMGVYLHFKTQETENDQDMDGGALGNERKLYYRELIARFGHHLALNWNLGEENTNSDAERKAFAQFFYDNDPYRHLVVLHTWPGQGSQADAYVPMLGGASKLTGVSIQTGPSDVFGDTRRWVTDSAAAGKPWVVANDEQGSANIGIQCDSSDFNHNEDREEVLWGNLMAGGAGIESYYGYQTCSTDLNSQDHRSRDNWYTQCGHAVKFFSDFGVPFWDMGNQDGLVSGVSGARCLRKTGESYVAYLPDGGSPSLDLSGASGNFEVRWFDPRNGGSLQNGSVLSVSGGGTRSLGIAPSATGSDWAVLVQAPAALTVSAGPDRAAEFPQSTNVVDATLSGSVSAPNPFTAVWSKLSGPGTVTFADTNAPATPATIAGDPGAYVLQLAATEGTNTASDTMTVTVSAYVPDTTPPVVTITEPGHRTTFPFGTALTVNATITDDRAVQVGELYVDDVFLSDLPSAPFSWAVEGLALGSHTLAVRGVDTSGNAATSTVTIAIEADTTAPEVTISAPADGTVILEGNPLDVTALITDNAEVQVGELYINGVFESGVPVGPYTWSLGELTSGGYTLTVRAVDPSGNVATSSVDITVSPIMPYVERVEGGLQFSWSPASLLLQSTTNLLADDWVAVEGATSPFFMVMTNQHEYFRTLPVQGSGTMTFSNYTGTAHNTAVPAGTVLTDGLPAGITATVGGDSGGFGVYANAIAPAGSVEAPALFVWGDGTGSSLDFSSPVTVPSLWVSGPGWVLANDPAGEQRITGMLNGAVVWSFTNTTAMSEYYQITVGDGQEIDELVIYPKWTGVDNVRVVPLQQSGQMTFDEYAGAAHDTAVPPGTMLTGGLTAGLSATVGPDSGGFGVFANSISPAPVSAPALYVSDDGPGASLIFSSPVTVPSLWTSASPWALANDPAGEQRITGKLSGVAVWAFTNTVESIDYFEVTAGIGQTIDELVVSPKWIGVDNIRVE